MDRQELSIYWNYSMAVYRNTVDAETLDGRIDVMLQYTEISPWLRTKLTGLQTVNKRKLAA